MIFKIRHDTQNQPDPVVVNLAVRGNQSDKRDIDKHENPDQRNDQIKRSYRVKNHGQREQGQ